MRNSAVIVTTLCIVCQMETEAHRKDQEHVFDAETHFGRDIPDISRFYPEYIYR